MNMYVVESGMLPRDNPKPYSTSWQTYISNSIKSWFQSKSLKVKCQNFRWICYVIFLHPLRIHGRIIRNFTKYLWYILPLIFLSLWALICCGTNISLSSSTAGCGSSIIYVGNLTTKRSKKAYMEGVVNPSTIGKLRSIRNLINFVKHLKRPIVTPP